MQLKKPHLIHRKFKLPKGCSVESFVIREIDGKDELESGRWVAAKGAGVDDPGMAMAEERMRVAIVAVNDQPVEQPYMAMNKWSTKTRTFLLNAWTSLNMVEEDELAVFLGAAEDLSPSTPAAEGVQELSSAELEELRKTNG